MSPSRGFLTTPSPNADWGYDVADFRGVHPDLGTLDDLDALIADAGERGIKVLLDLVHCGRFRKITRF